MLSYFQHRAESKLDKKMSSPVSAGYICIETRPETKYRNVTVYYPCLQEYNDTCGFFYTSTCTKVRCVALVPTISGLTKFHDISMIFPGFSKKFQVYLLNIFNVASNYFWINVYIKISPNQKNIFSTVSQGSHISGLTKFHDISMIFIIFCKIP